MNVLDSWKAESNKPAPLVMPDSTTIGGIWFAPGDPEEWIELSEQFFFRKYQQGNICNLHDCTLDTEVCTKRANPKLK